MRCGRMMDRLIVPTRAVWRVATRLRLRPAEPDPLAAVLARHARTFAFASRWLPRDRRRAVVVLYAFCRTLDDLVDEPGPSWTPTAALEELAAWRAWFQSGQRGLAPRPALGASLAEVQRAHRIPVACFLDLIDGLAADATAREVIDVAQLRHYCYQVAGTVGIAMAHVLGACSPPALAAAEQLGSAMQLTNILRDVGEDLAAGRLYLPREDLIRAGSSRRHLTDLLVANRGPDDIFRTLMRRLVARAYTWYDRGLAGIMLLPADCQVAILVAGRLYRRILTVIERNDYDVLRRRAATTGLEKVWEAWRALADRGSAAGPAPRSVEVLSASELGSAYDGSPAPDCVDSVPDRAWGPGGASPRS
jgi:phytoene synthase